MVFFRRMLPNTACQDEALLSEILKTGSIVTSWKESPDMGNFSKKWHWLFFLSCLALWCHSSHRMPTPFTTWAAFCCWLHPCHHSTELPAQSIYKPWKTAENHTILKWWIWGCPFLPFSCWPLKVCMCEVSKIYFFFFLQVWKKIKTKKTNFMVSF